MVEFMYDTKLDLLDIRELKVEKIFFYGVLLRRPI